MGQTLETLRHSSNSFACSRAGCYGVGMASWIRVYCLKTLGSLTAEQLSLGIRDDDASAHAGVDYRTLAESFSDKIDENAVAAALAALRVESDAPGFEVFAVHYRADPAPCPVLVRRWADKARVAEEVTEATELRNPTAPVLRLLRRTKEVIGIELGASQLEDFGIVVAHEVARYLAQKGDGLICDLQDYWTVVRDGAFESI
jgi:hypothetical protein